MHFYTDTINQLLRKGLLSSDDKILVVCGGVFDAKCLSATGLQNVKISNLDDQYDGYCQPYEWEYLDAEDIRLADGSYDWVIEHAGLHHCASPHKALLEMYRVCRKGVLAIEGRESVLMKAAIGLKLTPEYELEAVVLDPRGVGGVRHTAVPNFIYRWTENEVFKSIESAHPDNVNKILYFYGLALPLERLTMAGPLVRFVAKFGAVLAKILFAIFPKQGNQFGFAIVKTSELKPWIRCTDKGNEVDPNYQLSFDPSAYRPNPRASR